MQALYVCKAALEEATASLADLTAQQQDLQNTAEKAASASTSAQAQLSSLQQVRMLVLVEFLTELQ